MTFAVQVKRLIRSASRHPLIRSWVSSSRFIPLAYTTVTVLIGVTWPRLEHYFLPELVTTVSAPAAMAICSAVSSGMISLTGIVFSLTFVMVQFSATAYSPRLVLWVARDPVMSHALGVFISTFLYALIVIQWVDRSDSGRVPLLSTLLVFLLLVASMAMFIALIGRLAMLQINRMLVFTGNQGRKSIKELYSPSKSAASATAMAEHRAAVTQTMTYAGRPRVVQAIRSRTLLRLARKSNALIEVLVAPGDATLEMMPILRIHGGAGALDEIELQDAIQIGEERTFEQDPKYAIRLIVDIAIKALSPAINDPTTAVQALDQIEDLLLRLGRSHLDVGAYRDSQGVLRLMVPFPSWEDFLELSLVEIQHYGAESVQVMRRMKALTKNLTTLLPEERHSALQNWEKRIRGSIKRTFEEIEEQLSASVADRQGLGISHAAGAAAT
jgi:uncharacterized membrane protein